MSSHFVSKAPVEMEELLGPSVAAATTLVEVVPSRSKGEDDNGNPLNLEENGIHSRVVSEKESTPE